MANLNGKYLSDFEKIKKRIEKLSAKSPEPPFEQKMHPPVPRLPSRFGQVNPPLRLIL